MKMKEGSAINTTIQ